MASTLSPGPEIKVPAWLSVKEAEELKLKKQRQYYAGFDADSSADCLLSWRYSYLETRSEYVMAGLPVRETFPVTPTVGEVVKFTPILVANYGAGASMPQKEVSAKVISVEESGTTKFDYKVVLEIIYQ
jgi:hypothetical protein